MLESILKKHIKKVSFDFKEGKELELALKARLTKKEFKLFKAMAEGSLEDFKERLNLDDESLNELEKKLIKKLNSEKTKHSIYKI